MKIRLVHKDHRLTRRLRDKIAQLILWRDAGGRIIRIADINQTSFGCGKHFWKVVRKRGCQRHLRDFSAVCLGLFQNRFKGWISRDKIASLLAGECFCTEFQNLAGTIAEQDLIVIHAVQLGQLVNYHVVVFIRITAGEAK